MLFSFIGGSLALDVIATGDSGWGRRSVLPAQNLPDASGLLSVCAVEKSGESITAEQCWSG